MPLKDSHHHLHLTFKVLFWFALFYALLHSAWLLHLGFQGAPVPDDDCWAYYVANFSFDQLVDAEDPVFHRPRYLLNAATLAFNRINPGHDGPFFWMMFTGCALVIGSLLFLVRTSAGALTAAITFLFLIFSPVFTVVHFSRSAYDHAPFSTAGLLFGLLIGLYAWRKWNQGRRESVFLLLLAGVLTLIAGALFRESAYLGLVGFLFFFTVQHFRPKLESLPKWAFAACLAVLLLFFLGCIMTVPYVRWFIKAFFTGENIRMNHSYLLKHHAYILKYCLFGATMLALLAAQRMGCQPWSPRLLPPLLKALAVCFVGIGCTPLSSNVTLGMLAIGWLTLNTLYLIWTDRYQWEGLVWGVLFLLVTSSLMVYGDRTYFQEAGLLLIGAGGVALGNLFRTLHQKENSRHQFLLLGFLLALLLAPRVYMVAQDIQFGQMRAQRDGKDVADMNRLTRAYHYLPDRDRHWDFRLIPAMAQDAYNALFYGNPFTGVLAFRLGHTKEAPLAGYDKSDYIIPLPFGKLGKRCLAKETGRIRTLSRSVDTYLHQGEILLGAEIAPQGAVNLYRPGQGITLHEGHLYMFGLPCRAQEGQEQRAATFLKGQNGEILAKASLANIPADKFLPCFGYYRASATRQVTFSSDTSSLITKTPFLVDVTMEKAGKAFLHR